MKYYYCDKCDWDNNSKKVSLEDCLAKGHNAGKLVDSNQMNKEVKLVLIKNDAGITASNETEGTIDMFDETEEARMEFIKYMLEEFINKEVTNGKKYI